MGLTRIAPKGGLTIGEQTIPEGFLVSVSPWAIHHSKDIWGDDAHEFNPDRWLAEDAAVKEKHWIPVSLRTGHVLAWPLLTQLYSSAPAMVLVQVKTWPRLSLTRLPRLLSETTTLSKSTRPRTGSGKPTLPSFLTLGQFTLRSERWTCKIILHHYSGLASSP